MLQQILLERVLIGTYPSKKKLNRQTGMHLMWANAVNLDALNCSFPSFDKCEWNIHATSIGQ